MCYKRRWSLHERNREIRIQRKMSLRIKPLQLMQTFYNDYQRMKINSSGDEINQEVQERGNHAQKMTKFLINYKNIQKLNLSTIDNPQLRKTSKKFQITTPTFRTSQTLTSSQSKRGDIHPFLKTDHDIKQKQLNNQQSDRKEEITREILDTMYTNYKLMRPEENKQSVDDIKQMINRIKYEKKQIVNKVRYNFLINNAFKGEKVMLDKNKYKKNSQNKLPYFYHTKDRIFPNQNHNISQNLRDNFM